jgi:hypothetical protein
MHPVNKPEVLVANAQEKIKDGKVTDERTIGIIGKLMQSLVDLTIRLKK